MPADLLVAQVNQHQVVVGAAGDEREALLQQRAGEHLRVAHDLALILAEEEALRLLEADGLGGHHVHLRPALQAREDRAVDVARVLLRGEDERAARPAEGLVGGGGHDVADRHRVGVHTCRHEPRDVRDVRQEDRVYLIGNLPEAPEVDRARVGAGAADDDLRPHLERTLTDLIVVELIGLLGEAVEVRVVELAAEVHAVAVSEVAAMLELHREDLVARLEGGEVGGHVRRGAGVRLHIRVLGAEERLRAVDGERLDLIVVDAAAVVALARVALSVLVRQHRACGGHGRTRCVVLGGDQHEGLLLALEFVLDEFGDLRVGLGEGSGHDVHRLDLR